MFKSIKCTYNKATVVSIFRSSLIYAHTSPAIGVTLTLLLRVLMSMPSWRMSSGISRRSSTASASPLELVTHAHSPSSPNPPFSDRLGANSVRRLASRALTDSKCAPVPIKTNGLPTKGSSVCHLHTITCA